jgi:hypothetical protein
VSLSNLVLLLAFLALTASAMYGAFTFASALSALRDRHRSVWQQLGGPAQWSTEAGTKDWLSVYSFFWSGQYQKLGDAELNYQVRKVKWSVLAMLVLGIVAHTLLAIL